jgi:hypothetical protein
MTCKYVLILCREVLLEVPKGLNNIFPHPNDFSNTRNSAEWKFILAKNKSSSDKTSTKKHKELFTVANKKRLRQ